MIYLCCDKKRRLLLGEENVRRKASGQTPLNGIDYLEVLDHDAPLAVSTIERQRTLLVRLFEPVPAFTADNIRITGGERITPVRVLWAFAANAIPALIAKQDERDFFSALSVPDHVLVVRTDSSGDYSRYRLTVVSSLNNPLPPDDFDPLFVAVEFSFKVECPSDFDCKPIAACPPEVEVPLAIDYLAKDYASFRRLMLDRMSLLMPQWRERNPADLGVTLVELLAYVGDRLSYRQDATATEAYLDSARRRVSVRRHARLVDYYMHDGCNARAWVQIRCKSGTSGVTLPAGTMLLSKAIAGQPKLVVNSSQLADAKQQDPVIFETMTALTLYGEHDSMPLYSWGDERCCLPKGATRATLHGHFANLQPGDVLLFVEVKNPNSDTPVNPETRVAEDADRTRRHAVRLTLALAFGKGGAPLTDPLNGEEVTEISWDIEDAPPFPFCVSSITDSEHGENAVTGVSEVWGNIVPADHGETVNDEDLGRVPEPSMYFHQEQWKSCKTADRVPIQPRFRPTIKRLPLTQACTYDADRPAKQAMQVLAKDALPDIELQSIDSDGSNDTWLPVRDLLNSEADSAEFVSETEIDGTTFLRFGDDTYGRQPESGSRFTATFYRVGNCTAGNIGAEALYHIVTNEPLVVSVRNPMPACGGVDPETMEEVRHRAPFAFRTQDRAVTEADYAVMAERNAAAQRAAATFRWTGSWHTVYVAVDPLGGVISDRDTLRTFEQDVLDGLERYRMAGHDLESDEPRYVSLEIDMHVCVKPQYFRSNVRAALLDIFSNRILPDGRRGVFHPDNFTFGQPVYLSPLYAAAQSLAGVASVHLTTFQRQGQPSNTALQDGKLSLDRLEIARCDNDPSFEEHGVFRITLGDGK